MQYIKPADDIRGHNPLYSDLHVQIDKVGRWTQKLKMNIFEVFQTQCTTQSSMQKGTWTVLSKQGFYLREGKLTNSKLPQYFSPCKQQHQTKQNR